MTTTSMSKQLRTGVAKKAVAAGLALALSFGMAGCGSAGTSTTTTAESGANGGNTTTTTSGTAKIHYLSTADMFTDRDTEGSYDASSATTVSLSDAGSSAVGEGATVDGSTVAITAEGTYVLSGTLSNGQVVVDADGAKVQLVLDGASVTSADGAALYVANADKVFVTLAGGSDNALATSGAYAESDEGVDGAIFAKDDVTFNGTGKLAVTSAEGHGIVGNDDVKLCLASGGTLAVTAAKSAINANDSVRATGEGSYTLTGGTDGVHVATDDDEKGYVYVAGGSFDITAKSDGFDASGIIQLDGGSVTVAAGDDGLHAEADLVVTGGTVDVTESHEGLEGARVGIDGGSVSVVADDDGLNATGDDNDNSTGDLTWDDTAAMNDGTLTDLGDGGAPEPPGGLDGTAPEGMEPPADANGGAPEPPGGDMGTPPDGNTMTGDANGGPGGQGGRGMGGRPNGGMAPGADNTDAGTEAATGGAAGGNVDGSSADANAQGDFGRGRMGGRGGMGAGMMDADDSALIQITGGNLHVSAGGDGIDSNGSIVMSGGDVQVDGPVNTGNGALDSGSNSITITGGTLLATSAGGMEENATGDTTQPTFLVSLGTTVTGAVTVTDASGNEVASWSSDKQFNVVQMSSPKLTVGETYTLACDGASTSVTLDDTVTGEGTGFGAGGGMGAGRMMGGVRGNGDAAATDTNANGSGQGMRGPASNGGRGARGQQTVTDGDGMRGSSEVVTG